MATRNQEVNNDIYHHLGERWYHAKDDPVALLRAESRTRNPWVLGEIRRAFPQANVLDIGCGAGFLSNELARQGNVVTGLDASEQSLEIARRYDTTGRVRYEYGDANHLPYDDASFAVVCAMDFLEHVEEPAQVIAEVARVLQPGGLFFFHTFNRNFVSWLIGIKGVEWFVRNTPRDLHVYRLFITPAELQGMCERHRLQMVTMRGLGPVILQRALVKLLVTGLVSDDFQFTFTKSTVLGYIGMVRKMP